jgi:hypothetical protein
MDPNDLFKGWFSALGGFKSPIGAMGLILPGSPGAVVYQNYYKGCYTKNGHACNNAIKYKPLNKMMLFVFDPKRARASKGE